VDECKPLPVVYQRVATAAPAAATVPFPTSTAAPFSAAGPAVVRGVTDYLIAETRCLYLEYPGALVCREHQFTRLETIIVVIHLPTPAFSFS